MPTVPAALRELKETAPLYVETAVSREVRWSPETGHLGKLPGPRARKSSAAKKKTTKKTAPKPSKPSKPSKPTTKDGKA